MFSEEQVNIKQMWLNNFECALNNFEFNLGMYTTPLYKTNMTNKVEEEIIRGVGKG